MFKRTPELRKHSWVIKKESQYPKSIIERQSYFVVLGGLDQISEYLVVQPTIS